MDTQLQQIDELYGSIVSLVQKARMHVAQTANLALVYTNYEIGRLIVEREQGGEKRAAYGQKLLQDLAERLMQTIGKGYSYPNLKRFRQFYLMYAEQVPIGSPAMSQSSNKLNGSSVVSQLNQQAISSSSICKLNTPSFSLPWTHYLQLMRVEDPNARRFYEIEATKEQWSVRQLSRQIGSSLYERLALSRDKGAVMKLAQEGNVVAKPEDLLKEPLVLEFLGMDEKSTYTETDLETAILNKIQKFLMEMGKGFLFEARQRRFTFDEDSFFVDLVLYNRLLQCYVLIDLKTGKVTHQDIGQMQMYVNYYDRMVKQDFEKPTVGILLCKDKNEAAVRFTLPENSNIHAAEYKLYLPDAKLLQAKLKEWLAEEEDTAAAATESTNGNDTNE